MPLYVVVVDLGPERWRVRSSLPTRPVAGDVIRYPHRAGVVELDVTRVVLEVGTTGDVEVLAAPSIEAHGIGRGGQPRAELEERLERLRFRREAPTPA